MKERLQKSLRNAIEGDNVEEIKAKTEELKNASYKIAEELYKQQAAQGGASAAQPNSESQDAGSSNDSAFYRIGFSRPRQEMA